jgi:hypothetical protein
MYRPVRIWQRPIMASACVTIFKFNAIHLYHFRALSVTPKRSIYTSQIGILYLVWANFIKIKVLSQGTGAFSYKAVNLGYFYNAPDSLLCARNSIGTL